MDKEKLKDILSAPWMNRLSSFIESEEFDRITDYIAQRKASKIKVVPRTDRIFTALNKCPPEVARASRSKKYRGAK